MTRSFLSLFSGAGGGSLGFTRAGWDCVGAFDSDQEACDDHGYLTGDPGHQVDIGTLTPEQLAARCSGRPDAVITSPPCKGYSGCLPAQMSRTKKYVQLNSLAERGIWLVLEAWETPPPLILLENVPRIQSRGREWLDRVQDMLRAYGYACRETTHDCGEFGGLAQRRRRFLLVARHMEQVPEFLHEPPLQPVRTIGDEFQHLPVPLPHDDAGGPMHRLPQLAAINWVRLALIPAGGDWRDIPERVGLAPRSGRHNGGFGVEGWHEPGHTVVAEGSVRNTRASVQDPRLTCSPRSTVMGVAGADGISNTVVGNARHDNGAYSFADPRVDCTRREGGHGVQPWASTSTPVIGHPTIHNWPAGVADPRVTDPRISHDSRRGNLRVERWADPSHVVIGDARAYKGANVADPRIPMVIGPELDLDDKRPTYAIIKAADGTWHRPMTTLELAALQGFPVMVGGDWLSLSGGAHGRWRQRIGNAIPPPTAEAIARAMGEVLDAADNGTFRLCGEPVWVDGEERGATT